MEYTKIWYILVWLGDWHESCYYIIDDEKRLKKLLTMPRFQSEKW